MIRHASLKHRFVRNLPDRLEPGIIYVSMEFATSGHSCCCGCGEEVVTPFTPTDWSMTFDGESISLHPSVGNWNQPCRSHYVVRKGRVIEAGPWSDEDVENERRRDRAAKAAHYGSKAQAQTEEAKVREVAARSGPIARIWKTLSRWWSK